MLSVNFTELCSISLNPNVVITLQYLSYYYGKSVCNSVKQLANRLNLSKVPEIEWKRYLKREGNTYYSKYKVIKPMTSLIYRKVLTLPIPVKDKFVYLYYTSLLHPFNITKFLPEEVVIGNIENLLCYDLMEETKGGIILIKEREK